MDFPSRYIVAMNLMCILKHLAAEKIIARWYSPRTLC